MFLFGRFTSVFSVLYCLGPWVIIVAIGGYFGRLVFLWAYLGVVVPLLLWFVVWTALLQPLD